MVTIKELLPHIENYLIAIVNTRYVNEQELFGAVASMCQMRADRLAALDPARNWPTR